MVVPMIELSLLPLLVISLWVTLRRTMAAKMVPVRVRSRRMPPYQEHRDRF